MKKSCLAVLLSILLCPLVNGQESFSPSQNNYSQSNHGGIGLIQMPTARMNDAGAFSLNYQDSEEYRFWSASLILFPWMETTFRYSDVRTKLYSDDPDFSGDQTLKDKGIDVKFKLWRESEFLPDVSVGFRDFGGTGLFESEFIAASKRIGPFDFHLGIGWGYLGRKGTITNPFCELRDSFCERPSNYSGSGGKVEYNSFFKGPAALYGGIEYQTPWQPLRLKLEYDGNNYQQDVAGVLAQDSDFNIGVVYALNDSFDLNLNYQRGNTFGFGVNYKMDFNNLKQIKLDPPAKEIPDIRVASVEVLDKAQLRQDLYLNAGFVVNNYVIKDNEIILKGSQIAYRDEDVAMNRIGRVLATHLPETIKTYRVVTLAMDLPLVETAVNAEQFVKAARYESLDADVKTTYHRTEPVLGDEQWAVERDESGFGYSADIFWIQTFGNPEKFYMYQGGLLLGGGYQFNTNFSLQTTVKVNLLTNFDDFNFTVDAQNTGVPRVRTYVREYVTRSDVTMENLYGLWKDEIADNWYGQAYAGYLETMYGGVGGEVLYKPIDSSLAIGFDMNYVQQRDYDSDVAFFDYKTLTGHLSFYWTPQWLEDTMITASFGQYLAKDKGVTVDFAKRFDSGIVAGAYAAITDMSSEEYGEGSFTKGFYVSIPFDLFSLKSATGRGRIPWVPIARDGGQMLNKPVSLNGLTEARSPFMR
ncbi:MAG: YjbH domain-containing protein [Gammaproteobacteria bacterium]|nr:YjbH domain-containing protein [Gammaproteobacteria bacterium]MBU2058463.1 YjbH domain-containing protein [Gammaproteobacteria bacterium]MBU2176484.1 YjbH domain-containing protein [Gammaproteobacteria bacterium]MBU2248574.1 YjbH domain-containing protein [Gammaproteobacteria bacterium]MBU2345563.1 YjbH domain-containing protein [Gammaproteobacteria bacterium]